MKKKEMINIIENFDDDSDIVFVPEFRDLLNLHSEGTDISHVLEINNGTKLVIALME